jgi:hypothetical protein
MAADYGDYARRLERASGDAQKREILRDLIAEPSIDEELRWQLRELVQGDSFSITIDQAEGLVRVRAEAVRMASSGPQGQPAEMARRIKSSPLYRDPGDKEESNWISKAFESLGSMIERWIEALLRSQRSEMPSAPSRGMNLGFLVPIFWGLLGALLLTFLYFVVRHFSWKQGLERKAKALLAEDEPELTRDEYLLEADRLTAEGRFREAVRYLYLACLLAFDENGVARFVRGQTNWEHLRRIESSPDLPAGLDFAPATQKFDVVWYGMRIEGERDVQTMRDWYAQVIEQLKRRAA